MSTSIELGNERLLKLAAILDTADELHAAKGEPTYQQSAYLHPCGTPACAMGHWAAANPDRWHIEPQDRSVNSIIGLPYVEAVRQEFFINPSEEIDIFGMFGCDDALSAKDAAAYIRAFVARRQS